MPSKPIKSKKNPSKVLKKIGNHVEELKNSIKETQKNLGMTDEEIWEHHKRFAVFSAARESGQKVSLFELSKQMEETDIMGKEIQEQLDAQTVIIKNLL